MNCVSHAIDRFNVKPLNLIRSGEECNEHPRISFFKLRISLTKAAVLSLPSFLSRGNEGSEKTAALLGLAKN